MATLLLMLRRVPTNWVTDWDESDSGSTLSSFRNISPLLV